MKTLVICNEADMTHLVEVRLGKAGYDVVAARSGDEGLETARAYRPDVVILDPQVPGEHGVGLVHHLKTATNPAPVVLVLSAEAGVADIADAFSHGADDFVAQPFSPQGLVERVTVTLVRAGRLSDAEEAL